MPSEFDLIAKYFTRPAPGAALGVGDDAALLRPAPGMELAVSTDMLVAGRHFFTDTDPQRLGHKTLAVNLSDLAAMGALPRWATLAVALPAVDEAWLAAFSRGFFDLARRHNLDLVGGDTTRGPLNLCVTILGEVEAGCALRRDGGQAGDDLWVSGELGAAALGLQHLQGNMILDDRDARACLDRLEAPSPRVALGRALVGVAHACIDISDGLLADLGHILARSRLGAEVMLASLPVHAALARCPDPVMARHCLLAGGDDYELCFSAAPNSARRIETIAKTTGLRLTRIGRLHAGKGLVLRDAQGQPVEIKLHGYDHFAA
jgi:thiamine-monophosphate kinase